MNLRFAKLVQCFVILAMAACHPIKSSELKLVNGVVIPETHTPAAVRISMDVPGAGYGTSCSSTWVSHKTIITAAHCVEENGVTATEMYVSKGMGLGKKSIDIFIHPGYSLPVNNVDVALVIFNDDSVDNTKTASLSDKQPTVGASISIIGYGKFDHYDDSSSGFKRSGNNTIKMVANNIDFDGSPIAQPTEGLSLLENDSRSGSGEDVLNSQGDSGGPMFLGNEEDAKIIGVSSTVNAETDENGKLDGHYTNLFSEVVLSWLKAKAKEGVQINGLNGQTSTPNSGPVTPDSATARPAASANPGSSSSSGSTVTNPPPSGGDNGPFVSGSCSCKKSDNLCIATKSGTRVASAPVQDFDPTCKILCGSNGVVMMACLE